MFDIYQTQDNHKICRTCLKRDADTISIFEDEWKFMLAYTTEIIATKDDGFPQDLCQECSSLVSKLYQFKLDALTNHATLQNKLADISHLVKENEEKQTFEEYSSLLKDESSDIRMEYCPSTGTLIYVKEQGNTYRRRRKLLWYRDPQKYSGDSNMENPDMDLEETSDDGIPRVLCTFCKKRIPTVDMKEHCESSCTYIKQCNQCCFKSQSLIKLRKHREKEHGEKKVVKPCGECGRVFSNIYKLYAHTKKVHRTPTCICHICGKALDSKKKVYIQHMESHGSPKHKCHICPSVLRSETALRYHIRKHLHGRKFKCPQCPSSYYNNSNLVEHMRTHAGVKVKCPICGLALASVRNTAKHCRRVHKVAWKEAIKGKCVEFVQQDGIVSEKCS